MDHTLQYIVVWSSRSCDDNCIFFDLDCWWMALFLFRHLPLSSSSKWNEMSMHTSWYVILLRHYCTYTLYYSTLPDEEKMRIECYWMWSSNCLSVMYVYVPYNVVLLFGCGWYWCYSTSIWVLHYTTILFRVHRWWWLNITRVYLSC